VPTVPDVLVFPPSLPNLIVELNHSDGLVTFQIDKSTIGKTF
jgi:hypothetical protein